jgi:Sec-independent protein translocase protein TatA
MVLVVALLVLGPTKLPEVARHVGSAVNVFREMRDRMHTELSSRAVVETVLEGPDELEMDRTCMEKS